MGIAVSAISLLMHVLLVVYEASGRYGEEAKSKKISRMFLAFHRRRL